MSEKDEPQAGPVVKVARDLTEILALYAQLPAQAVSDSTARLMPGGRAMVALGPVANLEAWENLNDAGERNGKAYTSAEDEDPDEAWSAFQILKFWSEAWRREHGAEYGQQPTIATEANFIRYLLDWAWDNEPGWDDFAKDVNRARRNLEDILFAGSRAERTRIVCDEQHEKPQRLLVLLGSADDGSEDAWKCPQAGCKKRFNRDDVRRAHAKMLRSEGAERWVHQSDAIATLKTQGRSEHTVRKWLADGEGEGYCDPVTHEVWVWWPSLWRRHLMAKTRKVETIA